MILNESNKRIYKGKMLCWLYWWLSF